MLSFTFAMKNITLCVFTLPYVLLIPS
jgi:hypothetical protein